MYATCIAVVEATRARLFTFRRHREGDKMVEELREEHDLVDSKGDFARRILDELSRLAAARSVSRAVVCASPRILGQLRQARFDVQLTIDELARDFTKLTPTQLREQLASYGMLPALPRGEAAA